MKKGIALGISSVLLVSSLAACGKGNNNSSASSAPAGNAPSSSAAGSSSAPSQGSDAKNVKLTFFNTSAEVNEVFENLFKTYHEQHPNVTIELIPTAIGGGQLEKFQSLLASGNPATIANLDAGTILQFKDKFMDLESEKAKYVDLTKPGVVDGALLDGKFLGIPWTAQGYGLLYNKRVVEEAIGGSFDPASVKTRSDLAALFEKVQAAGKAPVMIHGADWSLGAHYLGLAYSLQSNSVDENRKFVDSLKSGSAKLVDNAAFNGLMDTFDLLKQYNARKKDPPRRRLQ
ncbi:ABC transporter substrate-binding protein [Cohnella rhizosphaerae]|uniref:ABC transporter substrate-binding protein n=1 Tax=Cohnella rhizosphaerae TaxID=1457232 RepID=A0A9X4QTZ6_9BACL|nr:ABC transporter substrate-binding protein [Cohnella rhizosphaerae]MDG0811706.1 ABC transporter substrate-binding protein [Cohnella rhizosphaerae]